jgi:two-component system OmpR family sensor kinase
MMRNRLFWKIFASIWLSLALTIGGVTVTLVVHNRARIEEVSRLALNPRAGFANRIVAATLESDGEAATRRLLERWPTRDNEAPLVVDAQGRDLIGRPVSSEALAQARDVADDDAMQRAARQASSPSGSTYLVFLPGSERDRARLRDHERDRGLPRVGPEAPVTLLVVAFFASLLVSALLARHITQPIGRLRDAFNALAAGRLDFRLGGELRHRRDEIGELGGDFDTMAARLEQLVAARDRLLHDVSHELRSPLARMQTAIGLAHQQPERSAAALERIAHEASRLDGLVGELLTLARLESGKQGGGEDYIELRELLASVVDDARFEATASGREIELCDDLEGDVVLHASGVLLHRAVENVVRNALQHTPAGSRVEVGLNALPGTKWLRIVVRDHGPGIAADRLASIFEPFNRGEASDSRGFGLGLAIARRAVEAHGGRIFAENVASGGLRIVIELPAS